MVIPKKIFQSWKTKDLQGKMKENVEKIKSLNPEYEHYLYDDDDCREFLLKYFGKFYLEAFDTLIPGAFKCDFWRYCVLYIHGGVYIDIDMELLVPLKDIIDENDEFISVSDIKYNFVPKCNIFQAFIATKANHEILLNALQITFSNIVTRRKEILDLFSITGPVVMGIAINLFWNKIKTHDIIEPGIYNNIKIFNMDKYYVYNFNNEKIIQNKFDEYDRGKTLDYTQVEYYNDNPRFNIPKILLILNFIFIIITILLLIIIFRK